MSCLEEALLQVDANVTWTTARAKDVAADSARRLVAGLSPLPDWTDLCMAPGQGGLTVLVDPVKGLDVADPDGVLQLKMAARRMRLAAISTALAQQEVDRQQAAKKLGGARAKDVAYSTRASEVGTRPCPRWRGCERRYRPVKTSDFWPGRCPVCASRHTPWGRHWSKISWTRATHAHPLHPAALALCHMGLY